MSYDGIWHHMGEQIKELSDTHGGEREAAEQSQEPDVFVEANPVPWDLA